MTTEPSRSKRPRPAGPRWLRRLLALTAGLVLLAIAALVLGYLVVVREVPSMEKVSEYRPPESTHILAADGSELAELYRERRTVVGLDQVPRRLVQAVISAEDKDFYNHPGINLFAVMRAVLVDALSGHLRVGASTITQQVVKNFFLTPQKNLKRKLKEMVLAVRLERNLSKDDILFLYLNQIDFGQGHFGVEEASLDYFGKHVRDLGLGEVALLAGLPQNPNRLDPRRHRDRAKKRQIYVLGRLLANGYINQAEHDREVALPLPVLPQPPAAPPGAWYVDEVRRQLLARFGQTEVETGGLRVETALDPALQREAERDVADGLRSVDQRQGYRGPAFRIGAQALAELPRALAQRMAAEEIPGAEAPMVADFNSVREADRSSVQSLVKAAHLRPLSEGSGVGAVVLSVDARAARVLLGPEVIGTLPFSSATWARPFQPEQRTAAPSALTDVLAPGDVIVVRVSDLHLARSASGRPEVRSLSLALDQVPQVEGSLVALDLRTRAVLALVGGLDHARSPFNRATQARRQPGSAFKPFLYAAALESGQYTPATLVDDSPEVIVDPWSGKAWKPQNFERDEFDGPMLLRKALAMSKNTVAVRMLLALGLDKVRAMAQAAGLTSEIPQSYTAALGTGEVVPLELVDAYATFADGGRRGEPVFIRRVLSRDGQILQGPPPQPTQAVKPQTAFLISDLMRSVIEDPDGTARGLSALGRPAAGKTGTTSDQRDGWFVGFTPSILAGAWVGFDDHRRMGSSETGGHCAGPIWLHFMQAATAGKPIDDWPAPPAGVVQLQVNRQSGLRTGEDDPLAVPEVFLAGTEPAAQSEKPPSSAQFYQQ